MKKLLFAGLTLISLQSHAAVWVEVAQGTGSRISIDLDSVAPSGKYWKAWSKTVYDEAQETSPNSNKYYTEAKYLIVYDCIEKTSVLTHWYGYDSRGTVVDSSVTKFDPSFLQERIPDSVGEVASQKLCSHVAKQRQQKAK